MVRRLEGESKSSGDKEIKELFDELKLLHDSQEDPSLDVAKRMSKQPNDDELVCKGFLTPKIVDSGNSDGEQNKKGKGTINWMKPGAEDSDLFK